MHNLSLSACAQHGGPSATVGGTGNHQNLNETLGEKSLSARGLYAVYDPGSVLCSRSVPAPGRHPRQYLHEPLPLHLLLAHVVGGNRPEAVQCHARRRVRPSRRICGCSQKQEVSGWVSVRTRACVRSCVCVCVFVCIFFVRADILHI